MSHRGRRPTIIRHHTDLEMTRAKQVLAVIAAAPDKTIFGQAGVAKAAGLSSGQVAAVMSKAISIAADVLPDNQRLILIQDDAGSWYTITNSDAPHLYRTGFKWMRAAYTAAQRSRDSIPVGTDLVGRTRHRMLTSGLTTIMEWLVSLEPIVQEQEALDPTDIS